MRPVFILALTTGILTTAGFGYLHGRAQDARSNTRSTIIALEKGFAVKRSPRPPLHGDPLNRAAWPAYDRAIQHIEGLGYDLWTQYCESLKEEDQSVPTQIRDQLLTAAGPAIMAIREGAASTTPPTGLEDRNLQTRTRAITLLTHLCALQAEQAISEAEGAEAISPILDALQFGADLLHSPTELTAWLGTSVIDQITKRDLILGERMRTPLLSRLSTQQLAALGDAMHKVSHRLDTASIATYRFLSKTARACDWYENPSWTIAFSDVFEIDAFATLCASSLAIEQNSQAHVLKRFSTAKTPHADAVASQLRTASTTAWRQSFDHCLDQIGEIQRKHPR